ncbi:helix-turn-helix domain-containing protein [Streptomyces canus]|uniref:helix-turn-helix domain-containing protein n=1 Tax=Streptomyces canus TaxID=58343 RepID=UPI002E25A954
MGNSTRAVIISNQWITGLTAGVIAELVEEIGPLWQERHQASLAARPRKRAVGAKHRLVFVDRLLATLVHLRHGATHDMLACWFGVDRSTITRAIGEVRPLLAERGCTVSLDVRLRSLAEVVLAHLKNWWALARHLGRREHMSDTIQAIAGLPSHQQTVDLKPTRQT